MFKKIILSLLIIYGLVGFVAIPLLLKPQIMAIVTKETNLKLSIDSIYLNPFIFRLQLDGVVFQNLDDEHLASFDSLEVDIEPLSLMKSAFHIKNIILSSPKISLVHYKDKTFNFFKILKDKTESLEDTKKEKRNIPRVIIDIIKIKNGGIDYEDFTHSKKFNFSLHSIGFSLKDVDTNHFDSSDAKIRFYSALDDGGFVDFKSEIIGFHPLRLKGKLDFKASKPYSIWKYIQDMTNLEVANGKLFLSANYYLNTDHLDSMTIDNMQLSLKDLRVKPKNRDDDVLNLKYININDVTIKPLQQDIHVKKITLNSLNIKAKRDKNGDVDWLEFIKTKEVKQVKVKVTKKDVKVAPWNITLDKITLEKIAFNFNDKSVEPQVNSVINELNIDLKNVTLLGEKPFLYSLNLLLNDKFKCNSEGSIVHKNLEINSYLKCKNFNLIHYKPYMDQIANNQLKTYNLDIKSAFTDFDINATVKDEKSQINTNINSANLSLSKVLVLQKDTKKRIFGFSKFGINSLKLNTKTKNISIKKTTLNNFVINVKKDKNGAINLLALVEPKESIEKTKEKEKAYVLKLKHFKLHSAKVNFKDESIKVHTKTKISKINFNAYNIDSREEKWLKYDLGLKINKNGKVYSKGKLRHTPLKHAGSLKLDKISLKEFTPYIQKSTYLKINDGYLSLDSKIKYSKKTNKPDLILNGSLKIEEFFLHDSRDNSSIASFISSELKLFSLNLFPSSLYIDEIKLNSFYVDAEIDKNKTMNLTKLIKPSIDTNTTNSQEEEKFILKIMRVNVSNGSAHFADFSLPVKFKTSIHDLNGDIYAISNTKGEISYIDIDGEIDKYGSTKLKGSIESSNIKSYTDMDFNFRNLGLNSLSGYSAQFAGYKINKGKLYLDLGYKIYDSALLGKNSIIIKNIELGDEIEDDNITKLPLGFAIALLEDSDGVIDIDMPVEGNLDKPDFKYGALVLKTFGRLILKAVTSPFTFLGSLLGINGDDLKYAEFEAGEFKVLPPQKEKLDNIATILIKKPKLLIGITGSYDVQKDTKAIQSNKLREIILKKSANKGVIIVNVLEDIYIKYAGKDILKTMKMKMKKEYKKDDIFKLQYQKVLMKKCQDIQEVTPKDLKKLANKRASKLKEYLVITKNIDALKIILYKPNKVNGGKWINTSLKIEAK